MKMTLSFNLPEEDEESYYAVHGVQYSIVLEDLSNWLRSMSKYEDKETVTIDEVRDKIAQLMNERDLR